MRLVSRTVIRFVVVAGQFFDVAEFVVRRGHLTFVGVEHGFQVLDTSDEQHIDSFQRQFIQAWITVATRGQEIQIEIVFQMIGTAANDVVEIVLLCDDQRIDRATLLHQVGLAPFG